MCVRQSRGSVAAPWSSRAGAQAICRVSAVRHQRPVGQAQEGFDRVARRGRRISRGEQRGGETRVRSEHRGGETRVRRGGPGADGTDRLEGAEGERRAQGARNGRVHSVLTSWVERVCLVVLVAPLELQSSAPSARYRPRRFCVGLWSAQPPAVSTRTATPTSPGSARSRQPKGQTCPRRCPVAVDEQRGGHEKRATVVGVLLALGRCRRGPPGDPLGYRQWPTTPGRRRSRAVAKVLSGLAVNGWGCYK